MARRHTQAKVYSDASIKAALLVSHGLVTRAAKKLGASHVTVRERVKASPELQAAQAAAREPMVDDAEDGLRLAVRKKQPWAIALTLRTLGKDRGYGPDHQFDAPTEDTVRRLIADLAAAARGDEPVSPTEGDDPCPSPPAGG
jgi:hypothetical protein